MARETKFIRDNYQYYNSIEEVVNAGIQAGYNRKYLRNAYYDIQRTNDPIAFDQQTIQPAKIGISENELREKYDIKMIVTKAASSLIRGVYIQDAEFIKQMNIRQPGYRQILDNADYAKYKGRAGGITYWSHPESILKMKNEGVLV